MMLFPAFSAVASALRPGILGSVLRGPFFRDALANPFKGAQSTRGLLWSVEREKGHTYKDTKDIINETEIER